MMKVETWLDGVLAQSNAGGAQPAAQEAKPQSETQAPPPAKAEGTDSSMMVVGIFVVIAVVCAFFIYTMVKNKGAQGATDDDAKAKTGEEDDTDEPKVSPDKLEEVKDELSLAELKAAKAGKAKDLSKEERKKLREQRRAKSQTDKAKAERDDDDDVDEDEDAEASESDDDVDEQPEELSGEAAREASFEALLDGNLAGSSTDSEKSDDGLGLDFDSLSAGFDAKGEGEAEAGKKEKRPRKGIPSLGSGMWNISELKEKAEEEDDDDLGDLLGDLNLKGIDEKKSGSVDLESAEAAELEEDASDDTDEDAEGAEVAQEEESSAEAAAEEADKDVEPEPEAEPEAEEVAAAEAEEASDDVSEPEPEPVKEEKPVAEAKVRTLREGLSQTRNKGFVARLGELFSRKLEDDIVEEVEEVLFTADIGVNTSQHLLETVEKSLGRKELKDADKVWEAVREEVRGILMQAEEPLEITEASPKPFSILVVGVNGSGKTTTIGKLAAKLSEEGKKVLLVAGDTFRAAAIEQLMEWGERTGCEVHSGAQGADPSSVIFDGLKRGEAEGFDVVLADTAGRLHNKKGLVEELKKVVRVAGKALDGAPHRILLVLDATNGQNALMQAKEFREAVSYTGIVMTKLDGTAKGGVLIGICDELKTPVHFIGIGEMVDDLRPFRAEEFVDALF